MTNEEFRKYAVRHRGISSLTLDRYTSVYGNYISPTIIEERQLNVASMDVFSRLMMDRIIFLGLPIDDYVANIIQAQLLYLDSSDPGKDIQIYFNTPGGSVNAVWGFMIQCSISQPILLQSVQVWQLQWAPFFLLPVKKEKDQLLNIPEL